MAHRHVTAHRSTLPVLVQQSKCSLEWHTGKCGLTETRPCADPTEQKLIGMAHREHASGESLQKPLPVLVQQSICFLARQTTRREDSQEKLFCASLPQQMLHGMAHRKRTLPRRTTELLWMSKVTTGSVHQAEDSSERRRGTTKTTRAPAFQNMLSTTLARQAAKECSETSHQPNVRGRACHKQS